MNTPDLVAPLEDLLLAWKRSEVDGLPRIYTTRFDRGYDLILEASGSGLDELVTKSVSHFIKIKRELA